MNGGAKWRKWGSLGQFGGTQGHRQCHQNFFLILDLKMAICGAFLVQFFAVQLKIWGGEKILSPRYIFIGGGAIAPLAATGIDATVSRNYVSIFYRFRDTAGYLSKGADFDPPTCILRPRRGRSGSNFAETFGVRKLESLRYRVVLFVWYYV